MVTAEPYFAVTSPATWWSWRTSLRQGRPGQVELIDAKFELLKRGQYTLNLDAMAPMAMDEKTPFDVYQARNAVRIARASGADDLCRGGLRPRPQTYLEQSETEEGGKKARIMDGPGSRPARRGCPH